MDAVDAEARSGRRKRKDREELREKEVHAQNCREVTQAINDERVTSALWTVESLRTAPPDVLRSMTSFRTVETLESFFEYLDAKKELSDGNYTLYRWSNTHPAHFHEEDGSTPDWIGQPLTAGQQAQVASLVEANLFCPALYVAAMMANFGKPLLNHEDQEVVVLSDGTVVLSETDMDLE